MDQKNTIVKCKAYPNCLFNYNGVCDNYVINIDADGKCECYVGTELVESMIQDPVKIGLAFKEIAKQMDTQRGQRTKCNFYEDACDLTFCKPNCTFCTIKKDSCYCMLKKSTIDAFGFMCSKYREGKDEV